MTATAVGEPTGTQTPGRAKGIRACTQRRDAQGDSVATDHVSPASAAGHDSPAGQYLSAHGVAAADHDPYGSRRGNHEGMIRATFAGLRPRNLLAPGTEGAMTRHLPGEEQTTVFDAATRYAAGSVPLLVIDGKEYGSGPSRDRAAKENPPLGVEAVLAGSFERTQRSNPTATGGVLPLTFAPGENHEPPGLTGEETFTVRCPAACEQVPDEMTVRARRSGGSSEFTVHVRIATPTEADDCRHGGIPPHALRSPLPDDRHTDGRGGEGRDAQPLG